MEKLRAFRKANNLFQKDISEYLNVTIGFVSAVERGASRLPDDKLSMLLDNPFGWNTDCLADVPEELPWAEVPVSKDEHLAAALAEIKSLKEERTLILQQLEWKSELVERLLKIIESHFPGSTDSQD